VTPGLCFFRSGADSESRFRFRVFSDAELDVASPNVCRKDPGGVVWCRGGHSPAPYQTGANAGNPETLPSVISRGMKLPSSTIQS